MEKIEMEKALVERWGAEYTARNAYENAHRIFARLYGRNETPLWGDLGELVQNVHIEAWQQELERLATGVADVLSETSSQ